MDDVTQTTSGTLQIRIQGLGDHGLVEGHPDNTGVSLDGTLEITLAVGYEPDLGDTFEIITANTVTGTFSDAVGESIGNGKKFMVQYNDTNVILQVVAE